MSVSNVSPIAVRPWLTLIEWQVFEVRGARADNEATRHLVGYALERWRTRASSPVLQFDAQSPPRLDRVWPGLRTARLSGRHGKRCRNVGHVEGHQ